MAEKTSIFYFFQKSLFIRVAHALGVILVYRLFPISQLADFTSVPKLDMILEKTSWGRHVYGSICDPFITAQPMLLQQELVSVSRPKSWRVR